MPKTYVIIPTYNEAENIEDLLKAILGLGIEGLVPIVVDDNSPDGTGKIAEKIPRAKVIIRYKNRGRGSAGIEGFKFALKEGADYIIEMDADFSHHPKYIPDLLKQIEKYDVVLGSRFVPGGKDVDRGFSRQLTTILAQNYIKWMLGVKVKDPTSGFRCFRRKVLEAIDLDHIISTGPSIVSEILYKVKLKGFSIGETPIVFEDRKKGETKLNFGVLLNNLYLIAKFRMIYK
ncbi:MAG: polyprenol monophosphomannose synthase [Candidatus Margulisiibacteriota bacterium]